MASLGGAWKAVSTRRERMGRDIESCGTRQGMMVTQMVT